MKISAKGRYALAAMTAMGQHYGSGEYITVIKISEQLGISKIYLEQVFSLLKRGGLVHAVKGAQGGYQLERMPELITVYDILSAVEFSLFEATEATVAQAAPEIETALNKAIFAILDESVKNTLEKITVADLMHEAEKSKSSQEIMFFI